ncbi:hypothetical protein MBH78_04295 [Oceanimonas sp. NS1]|nr:hypothetical protein [Oceanimonas sp. NS1]
MRDQQARCKAELDHICQRLQQLSSAIAELESKQNSLLQTLSLEAAGWQPLLDARRRQLAGLEQQAEQLDAAKAALNQAEQARQAAMAQASELTHQQQLLAQQKQTLQQVQQQLNDEALACEQQRRKLEQQLSASVGHQPDNWQRWLMQTEQQWQQWQQQQQMAVQQ